MKKSQTLHDGIVKIVLRYMKLIDKLLAFELLSDLIFIIFALLVNSIKEFSIIIAIAAFNVHSGKDFEISFLRLLKRFDELKQVVCNFHIAKIVVVCELLCINIVNSARNYNSL
jgi:hypothetical protein